MSVMSGSRRLFLAARIAFALFAGLTGVCQAQPIPFIDTHVHFDGHPPENFSGAAADAIRWMDRLGIRMALVMPPPEAPIRVRRYDVESFAFLRERYPNRFAPLGGPGKLGLMIFQIPAGSVGETQRREFSAEAARIIAQGAVGFGEIGIHHFAVPAMGERHQFTQAPVTIPCFCCWRISLPNMMFRSTCTSMQCLRTWTCLSRCAVRPIRHA